MKVDYGPVALIPKGDFDSTRQYHKNEVVSYQGSSYIVKEDNPPIGTLPTNSVYFQVSAHGTSFRLAEPADGDSSKALFGDGRWHNVYSESDGSTFYVVTDDETFFGCTVTLSNNLGDTWSTTIDNQGNAEFTNIKLGGTFTATAKSLDNVYTARSNSDTNEYYGAHVLRLVPQFNKIQVTASYSESIGRTVTVKNSQGNVVASGVMPQTKTFELIVDEAGSLSVEIVVNGITAKTTTTFTEYGETNTVALPLPAYGYCIDEDNSDPDTMVTYTDAAVGMTPAHMDFTNDVFDYGSWQNAFFMPKPCMLKFDGTVDYYLDPNDYTKKADGTASDVADMSYQGNAMMEWPLIYVKHWEVGNKKYCLIAPTKLDNDFHAYANIGHDGTLGHFYTNIYNACMDSNNKARSISNVACSNTLINMDVPTQVTKAENNGNGWYISVIADRLIINDLILLMIRSTHSQEKLGNGYVGGDAGSFNACLTGMHNDKGLFYGRSDANNSFSKVFGMENYYGGRWNRYAGLICDSNRNIRIKVTYGTEDGSTVTGYNTDGTGYNIVPNITVPNIDGVWVGSATMSEFGLLPYNTGGSSSTKYCDQMWHYYTDVYYAFLGGGAGNNQGAGIFATNLFNAPSNTHNDIATGLSYKP